ncbi:hypothetical protein AGMMS50276_21840 [Synergistales bacterium]|nr:hypothetical protein AGMMS50276_21840 [Synergistales bacterium]
MNALTETKELYTYYDRETWDDNLRWELIDGEAFCMSPGPSEEHQALSGKLFFELYGYFRDKECRVYAAPFDVLLPGRDDSGKSVGDEIDTVVQPDIVILCDSSKLRHSGIMGAPDVVFEILSPSTIGRDLNEKLYLYERSGVLEYLVVDPFRQTVTAWRRSADSRSPGRFSRREIYEKNDTLEFETFEELKIPLRSVFAR